MNRPSCVTSGSIQKEDKINQRQFIKASRHVELALLDNILQQNLNQKQMIKFIPIIFEEIK